MPTPFTEDVHLGFLFVVNYNLSAYPLNRYVNLSFVI